MGTKSSHLNIIKVNFLLIFLLILICIPVVRWIELKSFIFYYLTSVAASVFIGRICISDILRLQLKMLPVFIALGLLALFYDSGFTFLIYLILKISFFLFLSILLQKSFGYLADNTDQRDKNRFISFYDYLLTYFHMIKRNAARYSFRDYFSVSKIAELFSECLKQAGNEEPIKKTPNNFRVSFLINSVFLITFNIIVLFIKISDLH